MNANALGFTMESNGIRILEPFDTSMKFSNASGKTNIHISVSDIFMNFSFSILRLFLAVEEDILSFLRMTSKKMTLVCSEFDKVGTIESALTPLIAVFFLLVIIFRTLIMSHTVHLSAGYCVLQIPTVSKYLHFGDRMHHLVLLSSEII